MPIGHANVFPAEYRLLSRSEFEQVWNNGRKYHSDHFFVIILGKNYGLTRLGITVSKKVGGAVQRNRIKRLVREYFRTHYLHLPSQADISVIAKKKSTLASYYEICAELSELLTG